MGQLLAHRRTISGTHRTVDVIRMGCGKTPRKTFVPVFRPPLKEYEDTPKHHARTAAVIAAAVIAATACRVTRLKVKTHN
ncbi:hypothetical protein ACRALDRAFT_2015510 [Sodiomyces alcalophilus JCM 7366]|uniref:uncharacterized protein n=1 Tax=Sodiomyces alcalophilus JCM 7366 TaxID=591952 RepID=UPI0039B550F3